MIDPDETPFFDVLIVGAGHGGAQTAMALRQGKFEGTIGLVGDEPDLPYERPSLSKEYLAGEKPFERIMLRPSRFWPERDVEVMLGQRVETLDPDQHQVVTREGRVLRYGRLVWATGGRPRRLTCAGSDLAGVHTVRTRADVDRMMAELPSVRRAVVVGGGYIGLEAAATLIKAGKEVVLLEALDRVLARVTGEALSRFFEAEHRSHGIVLKCGARVDCLEGIDTVTGVRLADGEIIGCGMVVVGIGIEPAIEPLVDAGAESGNGVAVDANCRTTVPDVFAVGDCALHSNAFAGGLPIRLESVQNANDQAMVVAKTIMGQDAKYDAVPWFWSNQYDLKLQTIGLSTGHDQAVVRGDPATRSFSVVYLKESRVIALDCVNSTRDYVQGKRLVVERLGADPTLLANASVPLKDIPG